MSKLEFIAPGVLVAVEAHWPAADLHLGCGSVHIWRTWKSVAIQRVRRPGLSSPSYARIDGFGSAISRG
jgi:hypothetical protein